MEADRLADDGLEVGDGLGDGVRAGRVARGLGADGGDELLPDALVLEAVVEEGLEVDGSCVRAGDDWAILVHVTEYC